MLILKSEYKIYIKIFKFKFEQTTCVFKIDIV